MTRNKFCKTFLKSTELLSIFKALGDPNRMAIFQRFCQGTRENEGKTNVKELSNCCDVDLSVVSRHLTQLKKAGVLSAEKNGKEVHYSLNGKELAKMLRDLADVVEAGPLNSEKGE